MQRTSDVVELALFIELYKVFFELFRLCKLDFKKHCVFFTYIYPLIEEIVIINGHW